MKKNWVKLYPPERPHWHGDIKKNCRVSSAFIDFEKVPDLFLVFHCSLGSVSGCVYQQRSDYRQVKIAKYAGTGTNYVTLTKQVKIQHEKKPALNLKDMQMIRFWANIDKIYWGFCFVRMIFWYENKPWWKSFHWLSLIVVVYFVLTYI